MIRPPNPGIKLSVEQQAAITSIVDRMPLHATGQMSIIEGPAGSGKTTLVKQLIKELQNIGHKVVQVAPTHQAAAVLQSKTGKRVSTIQSHLEIRPFRKADKMIFRRVSELKRRRPSENPSPLVVIGDEASMYGSDLLSYIAEDRLTYGDSYIFIGDRKQINPVNEINTPIFAQNIPIYNLTEIHRQAKSNDNILLSQNLDWLDNRTNGKFYSWPDPASIPELIVDSWKRGEDMRYLAYTNERVNYVNKRIRDMLTNSDQPFIEGEVITMIEPFNTYHKTFFTSEQITIDKVSVKTIDGIKVSVVNGILPVIQPKSYPAYRKELNRRKEACQEEPRLWGPVFYGFVEQFAKATYPYAMTTHKAQGTGFSDCVIDISNIKTKCRNQAEVKRLLYTAITRTLSKNYFL